MIVEKTDPKISEPAIDEKALKSGLVTISIDGKEISQDMRFKGSGDAALFYDESNSNIYAIELNGVSKTMKFIGIVRGD